eukprot:7527064-Pyramimonas_sp.AAC.1
MPSVIVDVRARLLAALASAKVKTEGRVGSWRRWQVPGTAPGARPARARIEQFRSTPNTQFRHQAKQ